MKDNYTRKLLNPFKMDYFSCFTSGGNLDFLQKSSIISTSAENLVLVSKTTVSFSDHCASDVKGRSRGLCKMQ